MRGIPRAFAQVEVHKMYIFSGARGVGRKFGYSAALSQPMTDKWVYYFLMSINEGEVTCARRTQNHGMVSVWANAEKCMTSHLSNLFTAII
jgi:hypothetical protein